LPDLSGQDVCRGRRRRLWLQGRQGKSLSLGSRGLGLGRGRGLGGFGDVRWEVVVDGFPLYWASSRVSDRVPRRVAVA
jgi:hypothetical protein